MKKAENFEELLEEINSGNYDAYNEIFPLVYQELRQIAHRLRGQFYGADTLNTTAIVHEAYIKLVHSNSDWVSKAHFSAIAAKAMRQLLLNAARSKKAAKRYTELPKLNIAELEDRINLSEEFSEEVLCLEEALNKLGKVSEKQLQLVECRFFANMSIKETAEVLQLSESTVKRSWNMTRNWLYMEIQQQKTA